MGSILITNLSYKKSFKRLTVFNFWSCCWAPRFVLGMVLFLLILAVCISASNAEGSQDDGPYTGTTIRCEAESVYGDKLYLVGPIILTFDWSEVYKTHPTCITAYNGLLTKNGDHVEFYWISLAPDQTCQDTDGDGFYCEDEDLIDKYKNMGHCAN